MSDFNWDVDTNVLIQQAQELGLIIRCEDHGNPFGCTFMTSEALWDVDFHTPDHPNQEMSETLTDTQLSIFLQGLILGYRHASRPKPPEAPLELPDGWNSSYQGAANSEHRFQLPTGWAEDNDGYVGGKHNGIDVAIFPVLSYRFKVWFDDGEAREIEASNIHSAIVQAKAAIDQLQRGYAIANAEAEAGE